MKNSNLISVIIPIYNRTKRLIKAIQSVLNQSYQFFEILIIDDNSTENVKKLLKKNFFDKTIKGEGLVTISTK